MIYIFAFTMAFLSQVGGLFYANIVYYLMLIKGQKIRLRSNKIVISYLLFLLWALISTISFNTIHDFWSIRSLVQFIFTVQYFILIFDINIDYKKFEKIIYICTILLSVYILGLFLYLGKYNNLMNIFSFDRLWAADFIEGWPNSIGIAITVSMWLSYKYNYSKFIRGLFLISSILTTSRVSIFSVILIMLYFNVYKLFKRKRTIIVGLVILILFFFYADNLLSYFYSLVPTLEHRLTVSTDRSNILEVSINFILNSPLIGYGGNTLDQLYYSFGTMGALFNWPQTHNWVLEIAVRYGLIGLIPFISLLIFLYKDITDKDKKFLFILLLSMALFQIYIRNFVFIFYLVYLTTTVVYEDKNTEMF